MTAACHDQMDPNGNASFLPYGAHLVEMDQTRRGVPGKAPVVHRPDREAGRKIGQLPPERRISRRLYQRCFALTA